MQEEERSQVIKYSNPIEHNDPFPYHVGSCQVKLEDNDEPTSGKEDKSFFRFDTPQLSDYHDEQEIGISPHKNAFRVFPGKSGNVTGRYYYNTQSTITSHCPQEISTLHDTKIQDNHTLLWIHIEVK